MSAFAVGRYVLVGGVISACVYEALHAAVGVCHGYATQHDQPVCVASTEQHIHLCCFTGTFFHLYSFIIH